VPRPGGAALSLIVVDVSSRVIATILFFRATELVKRDMKRHAAVAVAGIAIIVFGIFLNAFRPAGK
jgi:hypothetical protein